eukprot:EG_transcript_21838
MELAEAARAGDLPAVQRLLGQGADPNDRHRGQTPLIYAAENGHAEVAALLLEVRGDLAATDRYAQTALHWACRNTHPRCAQLLVAEGATLDAGNFMGETPLDIARNRGNLDIIRAISWGDTGPYDRKVTFVPGGNPTAPTSPPAQRKRPAPSAEAAEAPESPLRG